MVLTPNKASTVDLDPEKKIKEMFGSEKKLEDFTDEIDKAKEAALKKF